jgi:hypothetical protein
MWVCVGCRKRRMGEPSWCDRNGQPIPKTIKCHWCGVQSVCFWFGPLLRSRLYYHKKKADR